MLAAYVENMLDSCGFGSKESSFKEKVAYHQKRHLDLISSYQKLCQESYSAMLSSTMKGNLFEMQNTHKNFLEGLNKTLESMFENNIELASHAPEKLSKVIHFHREAYESVLSSFPQAKQMKRRINNHYLTKGFRKLALGTMSAVLAAVAIPSVGKATDLFQPEHRAMTGIQNTQSAQDQINQMLDTPFVETKDMWGLAKDLMPQGPDFRAGNPSYANSRSLIYSAGNDPANYPKMVMAHQYAHYNSGSPLSAVLLYARAPQILDDYLIQRYPDYERAYSFVVVQIPAMPLRGGDLALKPQYLVHPGSPSTYQGKEYWTDVDWTVIPGAEGQIEPRGRNFKNVGLLHDSIVTHPAAQVIGEQMNLSGDVMHLSGFNKTLTVEDVPNVPSKDMYSVVTFKDEVTGKKIVAITYHWFLPDPALRKFEDTRDYMTFCDAMNKSKTMRQLIANIESADGFEDLTGELKRFIGLAPVSPVVTDTHHLGQAVQYDLQGFSGAEGKHRWTEGAKATITIPVRDGDLQVKSVTFKNTSALVTAAHAQQLSVFLNEMKVNEVQYNINANSHTIDIPFPPSLTGNAVITFNLPNAVSPNQLGLGEDARKLAIALGEMDITYRKHAIDVTSHHLGQSAPYNLEGFSGAEGTHRWTHENNSTVMIPIEQGIKRVKSITFKNTSAFVTETHPTQQLAVFLNGEKVKEYKYEYMQNYSQANSHIIKISIPSHLTGDAFISFEMPDAISPQQLGIGEDGRKLGISFKEMDVAFI